MNKKQDILNIVHNIIESKYNELNLHDKDESYIFWKIVEFEANAIGQIGHNFFKKFLDYIEIKHNNQDDGEHTEYDLIVEQKKFEIKTARPGKNGSLQFNGINTKYNYNYLLLIGISKQEIKYKLINKGNIFYDHTQKADYVNWVFDGNQKKKKLTPMNPGNEVNKKLTFSWNQLKPIDNLSNELKTELLIK